MDEQFSKVVAAWNAQADGYNQWPELCEEKKVNFAYSLGLAKGHKEGMEEAAAVGHESIKSYRLHHVQDEDGNGFELSDLLANAFGDADIGNALHEITLIGDYIYNAIRQAAQGGEGGEDDRGK